jgi:hypothetical protein
VKRIGDEDVVRRDRHAVPRRMFVTDAPRNRAEDRVAFPRDDVVAFPRDGVVS